MNGKVRAARKGKGSISLKILIFVVMIALFAGLANNYKRTLAAGEELKRVQTEENAQRMKNEQLKAELAAPVDDAYIEKIAKDKLGYRKSAEIIFYNDLYN